MSHIRSVTTAVAVLFLAVPMAAQGVPTNFVSSNATPSIVAPTATPLVAESAPSFAPTRSSQSVGVRLNAAAVPLVAPAPQTNGRSPALMIVGGAALLIGSVVGGSSGNIIMVSGAVVGLIGLWSYLN